MHADASRVTNDILNEGKYVVLRDFDGRQRALEAVHDAFREGLQRLGGDRAARVLAAGLSRLHEFVSPAELPELKRHVNDAVTKEIHRIACTVGRDVFGLENDFWISDLVITRIHYPFAYAGNGAPAPAGDDYGRRIANARAAWFKFARLFRLSTVVANVPLVLRQWLNRIRFRRTIGRYPFTQARGVETAAVHGPHLDIWNGLPFDGVTLWWAIDGVTEDGGLLLYPDLFRADMPRWAETSDGQAQIGLVYPPPHRVAMKSGELLLFSHDGMYHASQTNVSSLTRVAISTHMALREPVFARDTRFAFETFYASSEVARGVFEPRRFAFRDHAAPRESRPFRPIPPERKAEILRCRGAVRDGTALRVCSAAALPDGKKVLACFDDAGVIVARANGSLYGVDATCPHRGYNLVFGAVEGTKLLCPGHGVAFDLRDGTSRCDALRLAAYRAFERDGDVWVETAAGA